MRISVYDEAAPATAIYDSGLMYDSQAVYELPVNLKPRTRYFVKLQIESDIGEQASAQTYFETGKSTEPWKAEWITVGAEIKDEAVPVLGQVFTVSEEISQARMYIASAGLFRVEINDSKTGDEYLTPYCNDYSSWMQVITYDVTEQLKPGNNIIDVTLANGWYKGRFGLEGNHNLYGDTLGLLLELHIEYSNGKHEVIASDQSWYARRSPYTSAEIYDGVVLDYTRDRQTKFTADSVKLLDSDL
ncbi:MAG: alpha-L-rhamnosidase N-terminal domain-containing protein, partial [Acidaminococcaceae bacterium]